MSKTCFEFFISMYIFGYIYGKGRDISSQIYKVEYDESHKRSKNKMLKGIQKRRETASSLGV